MKGNLFNEMEKQKIDVIEEFMDFEDFQQILNVNEDLTYDGIFETPWNSVVDAMADKF